MHQLIFENLAEYIIKSEFILFDGEKPTTSAGKLCIKDEQTPPPAVIQHNLTRVYLPFVFYLDLRPNLVAVVATSLPTSPLPKEQVADPKCSEDPLLHSSPLLRKSFPWRDEIWRYQRSVHRNTDSMYTTLSALILH